MFKALVQLIHFGIYHAPFIHVHIFSIVSALVPSQIVK